MVGGNRRLRVFRQVIPVLVSGVLDSEAVVLVSGVEGIWRITVVDIFLDNGPGLDAFVRMCLEGGGNCARVILRGK